MEPEIHQRGERRAPSFVGVSLTVGGVSATGEEGMKFLGESPPLAEEE
jgi:hypothetical protein